MRIGFETGVKIDLMALHAALLASNIPGVTGVSSDYGVVFVEIPTRDEVTENELFAIQSLIASYSKTPSWDEVRKKRSSLLKESDWRIARAEDLGESQVELRTYRQALRDITRQGDPVNVVWPVKPWESA